MLMNILNFSIKECQMYESYLANNLLEVDKLGIWKFWHLRIQVW